MKILFIIPGAGDSFYCGNCFRDNLNASALRKAGHDVVVMPLYLPVKHKSFSGDTPLFFPATTLYAAHSLFRQKPVPKWIARFLNSDKILKMAASMSGTTTAAGLEGMTMSMINGDDAAFKDQVNTLIDWVENHEKFDIIHLSTSLLIGIAKAIKERINVPIVCSVQDEEVWIDSLRGNYPSIAWNAISENMKYVDKFIASSEFYRNVACAKVPEMKDVEVVYPGIYAERYVSEIYPNEPTIGFFNHMIKKNGLDILAEAFVKLKHKGTVKNLKLRVGGGFSSKDKKFLKKVRSILAPYQEDVYIYETYNLEQHTTFFGEISTLCVPITFDEGISLYVCEAMAAGRPVVEPATGSFPEIVSDAGVLYTPNNSDSLAEALEKLLNNNALYETCRENAAKLINTRYSDKASAEKLSEIYNSLLAK